MLLKNCNIAYNMYSKFKLNAHVKYVVTLYFKVMVTHYMYLLPKYM